MADLIPSYKYNAFISYLQAYDKNLAIAVREGLMRLGSRRYLLQFRALEIFRDESNASGHDNLAKKIKNGLDASDYLIVMARPETVISSTPQKKNWIQEELDYYLSSRYPEDDKSKQRIKNIKLIICIIQGEVAWNEVDNDFDWNITNCINPIISGRLDGMPAWVDFREIKQAELEGKQILSLDSPMFKQKVAEISANIKGITVDELIAADKRSKRLWSWAISFASFCLLLLALTSLYYWRSTNNANKQLVQTNSALVRATKEAKSNAAEATIQKNSALTQQKEAIKQKNFAINQSYSNAAYAFADKDPTIAVNFAIKALSETDNTTAKIALIKAFNTASWFYSHKYNNTYDADISFDGNLLGLITTDGKVKFINLKTGAVNQLNIKAGHIHFLPSGHILLWSAWNGHGTYGAIYILKNSNGKIIAHYKPQLLSLSVTRSGKIFMPLFKKGPGVMELQVIDEYTGAKTSFPLSKDFNNLGIECFYDDNTQSIIVSQSYPSQLSIIDRQGREHNIGIPENYLIRSIDVKDQQIALFLRGGRVGLKDGLGRYRISNYDYKAEVDFTPLKLVETEDAGGLVKILTSNKILINSTEGWAKIITDNSKDTIELAGARTADIIALSSKDSNFAVARRSGETYIYDKNANFNGQLLGGSFSDGLNSAYHQLIFSNNGDRIITVNGLTTIVWEKPKYQLTTPPTVMSKQGEKLQLSFLSYILKFKSSAVTNKSEIFIDRNARFITNTGQVFLQFGYGTRTDYIQTGMNKTDLLNAGIFAERSIKNLGYSFLSSTLDRVFITDPIVIKGIINQEIKSGRLYPIENNLTNSWVNNNLP